MKGHQGGVIKAYHYTIAEDDSVLKLFFKRFFIKLSYTARTDFYVFAATGFVF